MQDTEGTFPGIARRNAELRLRESIRFAIVLFIAFLAACGGGDSGGPTPPAARQDSASTVIGSGGGLVVTPNGDAGVQIPPGVLGQNATITVARLPTPGTPGQGPLPTSLNQYGPFYEISISPANAQLGDSVRVGVCQVTDASSPFYPPEATHDQLRLAHTVGGATEILERVGVSDFLNCAGVTANNERSGRSRLTRTFASMLNHTLGFLAPTTLHAAHGGLGGKVKSFSPFGAVDPLTGLVIGPEIAVAATALEENLGATAFDGTNYLVTFSNRSGSGQLTPAAQLVSATGSPISGQIVPIGAIGESPVVAFDGTNYLMAWRNAVSNPASLVGQFVSRTGALVGATFTIATTGPPNASTLVFAAGTYLMVYTRLIDPNLGDFGYRTFARTISTSGVLGAQLQVGSVLGNDGFNNGAFDGTNFFVVYTNGSTLRGRFISPDGVLGLENTIGSGAAVSFTTPLAFNGTNYLVAFAAGQPFTDAFAQLYSPAGAIVGGRITIANSVGDHDLPVAITTSGSNFLVSFIDGLSAVAKITTKARVVSGSGSTILPAFTVAGPRDGKVAAGFVFYFTGSKYLANFVRGSNASADDPLDLDTWSGKDTFISFLMIPIPQ